MRGLVLLIFGRAQASNSASATHMHVADLFTEIWNWVFKAAIAAALAFTGNHAVQWWKTAAVRSRVIAISLLVLCFATIFGIYDESICARMEGGKDQKLVGGSILCHPTTRHAVRLFVSLLQLCTVDVLQFIFMFVLGLPGRMAHSTMQTATVLVGTLSILMFNIATAASAVAIVVCGRMR